MTMRNFSGARSAIVMDQIMAILVEKGTSNPQDLAVATGLSETHVGTYLRHMAVNGMATRLAPAKKFQRGSTAAVWVPGRVALEREADDFARQVVVVKQWQPNLVRDPLDVALFGAAA